MVNISGLIKRLWGSPEQGTGQALDEQQTDSEARVGMIKREFARHPSKGLTPARLYQILEDAELGNIQAQHELFLDMEEKDSQIASDLAKRGQLAAELEWQIVPPDGASALEKKARDFCAELFSGLEVEDMIIDMASAVGHGWANLELDWSMADGKRIIGQPTFRPHWWFRLALENQNELRLRDLSGNGAPLWPLGWVQHRHKSKAGYVARSGLHRVLAWPYLFSNYALGDLAELLEIYGLPARIGTYPKNASKKEKATLLRAVTSLGHRAAGIIPEGMKIDFQEAAQGKGDLYQVMLDWCEKAKSRAILGNTLTSGTGQGTNTNALGKVHERSQQSLIHSDVRQYSGTIIRDILWPLAALNYGITDKRRAPRFFLDTGETEDFKMLADSLPVFVDLGAKIPTWWLHEKTQIPQAGDGDEVLQTTTPTAVAPLKGAAALTANMPGTEIDPAEMIADQLGDKAKPAVDTWLEQIKAMLDTADSLAQFKEMLLAAYDDLPAEQLAGIMGEAMLAAHAAGRFDVEETANG